MSHHLPTRIRKNDDRNAYIVSHPLAFTIGVWAVVAGIGAVVLLALPTETIRNDAAIGALLPVWALYLWGISYTAGGLLMVNGIWNLSLRSEVAGCLVVAGTQLVNVYTIVVVRGAGAGFVSGVGIAVCIGLLARAYILVKTHHRRKLRREADVAAGRNHR